MTAGSSDVIDVSGCAKTCDTLLFSREIQSREKDKHCLELQNVWSGARETPFNYKKEKEGSKILNPSFDIYKCRWCSAGETTFDIRLYTRLAHPLRWSDRVVSTVKKAVWSEDHLQQR